MDEALCGIIERRDRFAEARYDAVMVGVSTVLVDNPRLTARTETSRPQPKRVVLDRELRTPVDAALFDASGGEICIVTSEQACSDRAYALERAGASARPWSDEDFAPARARIRPPELESSRAMLEGGETRVASFLDAGCVDYATITMCPQLYAGAKSVRYGRGSESRVYDLTHCHQTLVGGRIILDAPIT